MTANFPPQGWAFCNGQLMPISQNTALFSLLGTFYGGDGRSTFALPNLQGSFPIAQGQGAGLTDRVIGESGGAETVTLLASEMPTHVHGALQATAATATTGVPTGGVWAASGSRRSTVNYYTATAGTGAVMAANALGNAGGSLPHNNMPPFLAVNFCIALQGIFPPRQ